MEGESPLKKIFTVVAGLFMVGAVIMAARSVMALSKDAAPLQEARNAANGDGE